MLTRRNALRAGLFAAAGSRLPGAGRTGWTPEWDRTLIEAAVRQLEQFRGLFPGALHRLITHRVKLEDAPELLRRPGGIKQVVQLAG